MADADSTSIAPSDWFEANMHLKFIENQLEKIYAVASRAQLAEESRNEDHRDINVIRILELIGDISGDASSIYALSDLFVKAGARHG